MDLGILVRAAGLTLASAVAAAVLAVPAHAETGPAPAAAAPPRVLFIGDSMTSQYNNTVGDYKRGWWSYVAAAKGWTPMKSAEYGSGFLRRGTSCRGTRFADRLPTVTERKPDVIVVAGGRNDGKKCVSGKAVAATTGELVRAATAYFEALAVRTEALGVDEVYVLSPWAGDFALGYKIRPAIRDAALRNGFTWISTPFLPRNYTTDGLHQNASGNRWLRDHVLIGMP